MTAQLSIFDELEETRPHVECPHCGHSWPLRTRSTIADELERHSGKGDPWRNEPGACVNQQIVLQWVLMRATADLLMTTPAHPAPRVLFGGNELLFTILKAKSWGCSDALIGEWLTAARGGAQ